MLSPVKKTAIGIIFGILFFCVNAACFGSAAPEHDIVNDKYSKDISGITEYFYKNTLYYSKNTAGRAEYDDAVETTKEYQELGNGVYVLTRKDSGKYYSGQPTKIICYDISPAGAEIRFLQILTIGGREYSAAYHGNNFEITAYDTKAAEDSAIAENGRDAPGTRRAAINIVFIFNENGQLKSCKIMNRRANTIENEYEYIYNDTGKLSEVYSVREWGKVLQKTIYYDGVQRLLKRPFFADTERVNLDQIIVFDNDSLKYNCVRVLRRPGPKYRDGSALSGIPEEDAYCTLFEFDGDGTETRQTTYHYNSGFKPTPYEKENIQYDSKNNWISAKVVDRQAKGVNPLYGEYKRKIKYAD